jgi:hypothetical protein
MTRVPLPLVTAMLLVYGPTLSPAVLTATVRLSGVVFELAATESHGAPAVITGVTGDPLLTTVTFLGNGGAPPVTALNDRLLGSAFN